MSVIAGLWLAMLQDAAGENQGRWPVAWLFDAISQDPDISQWDRAAIWRSLTTDEKARLKAMADEQTRAADEQGAGA